MTEPSPEASVEARKRYKSLEEAHRDIVGFDIPKTTKEAPENFTLPLSATGDMFKSLQEQDNLIGTNPKAASGTEWSQAVGLIDQFGQLKNSKVTYKFEHKGEIGVVEALEEMKRWLRPMVGLERKPLTYWHIHPPRTTAESKKYGTYFRYGSQLSVGDVGQRVGEDRKSLIYTLGAPDNIKTIIQAKSAIPVSIPPSTIAIASSVREEILNFYDDSQEHPNEHMLANYLLTKGYILYEWANSNDYQGVMDAYSKGAFINGIPLKQVV